MKKKFSLFSIILFSVCSFVFAKPDLYSVYPDSEYDSSSFNSPSVQSAKFQNKPVQFYTTSDGLQISVSSEFSSSGNYIKYYFNIQNRGHSTYYFDENSIFAYEGNYQSDSWSAISYKPASQFYKSQEEDNVFTAVVVTAITLGSLLMSDIDVDVDINVLNFVSPLVSVFAPVPVVTVESNSIFDLLALGSLFYLMSVEDDVNSLDYLERNLLYSATIRPNEEYTGVVFVPEGKGPDYKVSFQVNPSETVDFRFARSDRDAIINPWGDKKSMVAVVGGISVPNLTTWSLYSIISGNIMGGYFGCSFNFENGDLKNIYGSVRNGNYNNLTIKQNAPFYDPGYDYKFSNITGKKEDCVGVYGGFTTKLCPHLYLMYGCGVEIANGFEYGSFERRPSNSSGQSFNKVGEGWVEAKPNTYIVPQVGINISYGIFDFAGLFDFRINKGFRFNVLMGLSF